MFTVILIFHVICLYRQTLIKTYYLEQDYMILMILIQYIEVTALADT